VKPVKGADVGQYVRKQFALAVKTLYGAIPESQDAAAVAKRAQRDAKAALAKAARPHLWAHQRARRRPRSRTKTSRLSKSSRAWATSSAWMR
jgi:hypothetical protein